MPSSDHTYHRRPACGARPRSAPAGGASGAARLGDTVNTTARLASAAQQGEVLVTAAAATAADLDPHLERRSLELKGKQLLTEVVTLTVTPSG